MLIIDAHLDLAWNALQWNRNLCDSVYTIRAREGMLSERGRALGTVALPQMREGRIALSFATLLARSTGHIVHHADYATPMQAYAIARGQLAYYRALEREGHIRVITNAAELNSHIAEWEAWDVKAPQNASPPLGFVILMEGADPILDPRQLAEWHANGLRVLGLTHYGNGRYAGGTGCEDGLADNCVDLLREMQRLNVLLDLSHCSDKAFWQALKHFDGPVLASHNNCRALVPHQRQFSDEQIQAIVAREGVIGAVLDTWMLMPGWSNPRDDNVKNPQVSLQRVADHIDHVCQLAGNAAHAAIGSDLDGWFGRESTPYEIDTIADLQKLPVLLQERGYSADDIRAIMHGNWLRLLYRSW